MVDKVTLGEVSRKLDDMDERYTAVLKGIDTQVRMTNGRTTKLESQVEVLNREMRDIRIAPQPVVLPDGESISIRVSPKLWAVIGSVVSALAIFAPMVQQWIEGLFHK